MASRLGHRPAGGLHFHTQGARLPDRRRCRAAPTGRRDRAGTAAKLLSETRGDLSCEARSHARHLEPGRLPLLQARRRVLHHDGYFRLRICRRSFLFALPRGENRYRGRAGIELLRRPLAGIEPSPLHVLQEGIHTGRGSRKAFKTPAQLAPLRFGFRSRRAIPVLESAAKDWGDYRMAMEFDLIPKNTLIKENGNGPAVDIRASQTRTFFCVLTINEQNEQESV